MTKLIEMYEAHVRGHSPEDIAEDIALGLTLTGVLFLLLFSIGRIV